MRRRPTILRNYGRVWVARLLGTGLAAFVIAMAAISPSLQAAQTVQVFYVPIPEVQGRAFITGLGYTPNDNYRTVISITATFDGTIVYYDEWEDGYEYDIANPTQSTTKIFGNGILADGAPPGCAANACDVVNSGTVIILDNNANPIPANPRDQGNIFFDARDKIASTQQLVITRAGWAVDLNAGASPGVYLSDGVEVFDTRKWGTSYLAPAGQNSAAGTVGSQFTYTALSIMADRDGTVVAVDGNADGTAEINQTLNQGESLYVANTNQGATVTCTGGKVQVDLLAGQNGATAGRWWSLVAVGEWDTSYYSPTGLATARVILYNPDAAPIIVTIDRYGSAQTTVTVPLRGIATYTMTAGGGAHLYTTGVYTGKKFFAIAAVDWNASNYDWGFTLIPEFSLTPSVVLGWAPGSDPYNLPFQNVSKLFVAPTKATTVYVDYDGVMVYGPAGANMVAVPGLPAPNNCVHYDVSYALAALQAQIINDPDLNLTGARAFTVDGTRLAAAWGEDPASGVNGAPGLDLGTTVLPFNSLTSYKYSALVGDFNSNGGVDPGEVIEYTIRVHNSGIIPITGIVLSDTLDTNTTYVAGTTYIDGVFVADPPIGVGNLTLFPFDESGYNLVVSPALLQPAGDIIVKFQATVKPGSTATEIVNTATANSSVAAEQFTNLNNLPTAQGALTTTKTSTLRTDPGSGSSPPSRELRAGDVVEYQVSVTNNAAAPQNGITLTDYLPYGSSYVASTTTVSGWREKLVKDVFDQLLYSNNDGAETWAGDWTESDGAQSPTAGNAQVVNGELRLMTNGSWAQRVVNLSEFQALAGRAAMIKVAWRTNPYVVAGDAVKVQISGDQLTWVDLVTLTNVAGAASGSYAFWLPTAAPNTITNLTTVRFLITAGYGLNGANQKYVYFDKVELHCAGNSLLASDDFAAGTYAGGMNWGGNNWVETDNVVGAPDYTTGQVLVNTNALRFNTRTTAAVGNAAARKINASGYAFGTLVFDVTPNNAPVGTVAAQISRDGTTFTTLETFGNATFLARSYDISAYLSANTTVRFRVATLGDNTNRYIFFDNVKVNLGKHLPITKDNVSGGVNADLVDGRPPDPVTGIPAAGPVINRDGFALAPGESMSMMYQVQVNNPPNVNRLVNTVTSTSWERVPPASAFTVDKVTPGGAIAGTVWLDADLNHAVDVGEQSLVNIRVYLDTDGDGSFDVGEPIALTGTHGEYYFQGLTPGTYNVRIDTSSLPTGLVLTTGAYPTPKTITGANEFFQNVNFGYSPAAGTAVIGNFVWSDADGDGEQDPGEVGIANVSMALMAGNGADTIPCTADDVPYSPPKVVQTSLDGSYLFTGVAPGSYRVCADVGVDGVPPGHVDVLAAYTATAGPHSAGHEFSSQIDVVANEIRTDVDFGYRNAALKGIADRVWFDANNNGAVDTSEPGIAGVTVNLFAAGLVKGSTMTDSNGNFSFSGLPDGTYTITIQDADGKLIGFSGTTVAGQTRQLVVTLAGSNITGANFGYNAPGSIGDMVWSDANGNGLLDGGEPGISGVTVQLYFDTNGNGLLDLVDTGSGVDAPVTSTATDSAGRYRFQVSTAGRYFVSIPGGQPVLSGFTRTTGDDDPAAAGDQARVDLYNLLTSDLSADFGYRNATYRAISGFVFSDDNKNGAFAAPEGGISGVTLDLLDNSGNLMASTTSAADGSYTFPGLPNGIYKVRVTDTALLLDGWSQTSPALPALPERNVTLAGVDSGGNNFGFYKKPTRVFLAGFTATTTASGILLSWETTTEINTAGFFLYRLDGGVEVPVNTDIVPALLESTSGGTYTLLDAGASGTRLRYKLVEVLAQGTPVAYGPFAVTPQPQTGAALDRYRAAVAQDQSSGTRFTRQPHQPSQRERELPEIATQNAFDANVLAPSDLPRGKARLTILQDGLYRIKASDLASILHFTTAEVQTLIAWGQIILSHNGKAVAYLPVDMGASLLFYGQGSDTVFSGESVYWIALRKGPKMQSVRTGFLRPEQSGQSFVDQAHAEEDRMPNTGSATDPLDDYWYWDYLVAGNPTLGRKPFALATPGATSDGEATLTVSLRGATDTAADPDHHVIIRVNGTPVGESRWNGMDRLDATCTFDQGLLVDGENTVEVEAALDDGVRYSIFYLDALDISYRRRYEARDDRITVRGEGNSPVTVSGFSSRKIRVFELTIADRPKLVTGTRIGGTTGNFTVTFQPFSSDTPYLVVSEAGVAGVAGIAPWVSSGLAKTSNAADYLIITGSAMTGPAETLAAHRRAQGLTTKVVTVDTIMDEFNGGAYDPAAIRNFLAWARQSWAKPPRYVLLAGDGSFDYRDRLGHGECIVPPAMVSTPYGLFPSDIWFVDDDADHVPSLAIGRLPAKTGAELQAMVDKIIAYERESAAPPAAILYAADQPDAGGDFTADSNALMALVPLTYTRTTDYLAELGTSAARSRMTSLVNSGLSQVNYLGHAGYDRLADEGLLLTSDVSELTNAAALPLFTIFSCLAGSFSDPGYINLGEALVLKSDGGAAAVFASTGLTLNDRSVRLAGEFLNLRYSSGASPRLGDLALAAMRAYGALYGGDYTLDLYVILGDPALVLR